MLTAGCEIWYDSRHQDGDLRILIAASPQAELSNVQLSIERVEVQHNAGQWHRVPLNSISSSTNWQEIKLDSPLQLARSNSLPTGHYQAIRVFFSPNTGTAERHSDNWQFPLYTSNVYTAKLNEPLRVDTGRNSEVLVWLDLQRSMAFYEDTNENYYRLDSPGLYAYSNNAAYIYGDISDHHWDRRQCPSPDFGPQNQLLGAYAYIYENNRQDITQLPDLQLNNHDAPIMSSPIYQHSSGGFYYNTPPLKQGNYIVALTCHGRLDDPYNSNSGVHIGTGLTVQLNKNIGFSVNF